MFILPRHTMRITYSTMLFFALILTKILISPVFGQFSPNINNFGNTPINGSCGSIHTTTINSFPTDSSAYNALCSAGEFDQRQRTNINQTLPLQTQTFTRRCKGINGGSTATCNANGSNVFYTNQLATACGVAQGRPFMTTSAYEGIPYTNRNNVFLGNLCTTTNSGVTLATAPLAFNQTPLGRTWQCPTFVGQPIQCAAPLYRHGLCGNAAETGHSVIPTSNLCAPGAVQGNISFDNETLLWKWNCQGEGNGNVSFCQARNTADTTTMQSSCNPDIGEDTASGKVLNSFPGQNGCFIGSMSYWTVVNGKAQRKCATDAGETAFCANITFTGSSAALGNTCNTQTNGQSFTSASDIFARGLCAGNTAANFFQKTPQGRTWTCEDQVCAATKSDTYICGYAQNIPTKLYPTQGLCKEGFVHSLMQTGSMGGLYRERECRNTMQTISTSCKAPRIVDGSCSWTTTTNANGYATPQEVLQDGLCTSGVPMPLVPLADQISKKRKRQCVSPTAGGQDSQHCYANVHLPQLEVVYDIPKPGSGAKVGGPVRASLSGINLAYISITNPVNQPFYSFSINNGFTFRYQDWAGNTGFARAFVDWIDPMLPNATLVLSTTGFSSGTITASLTNVSTQLQSLSFSGSCIQANTCVFVPAFLPENSTVIFSGNGNGQFILTDTQGKMNTIPVVVTGVDRIIPFANIQYDTTIQTSQAVTARIVGASEPITIKNNEGKDSFVFTGNGEFIFHMEDRAGNINYLTASVTWIDNTNPTARIHYSTTGITTDPVIATLQLLKTGTTIVNNSGSTVYTFTYNHEFTFILEDAVGNRGTVTAKVSNIQAPILDRLIETYTDNVCSKFTKRLPIDIQGNEYNFHIITMIKNCLMRGFTMDNNHTYFYPRQHVKRKEFLTIVGRFIRLVSEYQGNAVSTISNNFIGVSDNSLFGPEITEADARGLLFYVPIIQSGNQKTINGDGAVSAREAKYILGEALTILSMNKRTLDQIMGEHDYITRGELSFIMASLLHNVQGVALGENVSFLQALQARARGMTPEELRQFVVQIYLKLRPVNDSFLLRIGLEPNQLKADLLGVAEGRMPNKQIKPFFQVKTVMDNYLRNIANPFNSEIFNDNQVYSKDMYKADK